MMSPVQGSVTGVFGSVADIWGTKAQTLARLAPLLRASCVPESLSFTFAQWCSARTHLLAQIQLRFGQSKLAVRSSRHDEDRRGQSQAGRYRTELNMPAQATDKLSTAVDAVFRSYGAIDADDEVLLQPMVADARACYVAATHTLDAAAPYYVLDFASGAITDIVTRGSHATTTFYLARAARLRDLDDDGVQILRALRELERLHPDDALEAEFVLTARNVFLLQVRPIAQSQTGHATQSTTRLRRALRQRIARREQAPADIYGRSNLYGLMPDWNPAELLGAHPRPLAMSIFRRLIAHANWRRARAALGYRRLRTGDLLVPLAGRPYVDVRLSFNSLLPAGIAPAIGSKLVDAWLARLRAAPILHDKVEFDVASTCVDFDFIAQHKARYAGLLNTAELRDYRERLLLPTKTCLDRTHLARAERIVGDLHRQLSAASLPGHERESLQRNLQCASRCAALPFAQIARQAFVAEALLRSAQRCGALSSERLQALRHSVVGVTGAFLDAWREADTPQAITDLHARFGHLRPGTFEITVPCYAAQQPPFLVPTPLINSLQERTFVLDGRERAAIDRLAAHAGIGLDAERLVAFYLASVRAREYAKFVLSMAVSLLLEGFTQWGRERGLGRDTLTWLGLERIVGGAENIQDCESASVDAQRRYEVERRLRLPVLLQPGDDLSVVRCAPGAPSFHGRGVVEARIVEVDRHTRPANVPMHCILAIESADPGFDWIFTRAPAALLTAYGGPNSHMAIRCAELACPAVLGFGVEGMRRALRGARAAIDFDSGTLRGVEA